MEQTEEISEHASDVLQWDGLNSFIPTIDSHVLKQLRGCPISPQNKKVGRENAKFSAQPFCIPAFAGIDCSLICLSATRILTSILQKPDGQLENYSETSEEEICQVIQSLQKPVTDIDVPASGLGRPCPRLRQ